MPATSPPAKPLTVNLRLLGTTDLHMALLGHDYAADKALPQSGLTRLATLIAAARSEARAERRSCLLFDNGDLLQGSPLGDELATRPVTPAHPLAACFNLLRYDAVGLGNHDLDHSLPYLAAVMAQMRTPVVSSNIASAALPKLHDTLLLEHRVQDQTGAEHSLRIGITSVLPQQTALWNRHTVAGQARISDPIQAASRAVTALRARGSDLVVVLAHLGIGGPSSGDGSENAALTIAAIDGVDAIFAGHTHRRFPGPDHDGISGADTKRGTLHGVPAAMPAAQGTDLAQIDLTLQRDSTRCHVTHHQSRLRCPAATDRPDTKITALVAPAHRRTRAALACPVGTLDAPLHSYFDLARSGPLTALMAEAKIATVRRALSGGPLEDMPILAATNSGLTGGQRGPDNFVYLDGGQILLRHIAGLCPYPDLVWAVRATGAQILDWLERAARCFNHLRPDQNDQGLIHADVPGYRFDTIHGLHYCIDPTAPARYDPYGRLHADRPGRISDLTWQGRPLEPDQTFIVATTQFRAAGGGGFRPVSYEDMALRGQTTLHDALIHHLKAPDFETVRGARPWRFAPDLGLSAVLHTAPAAIAYLREIADLAPVPCGITEDGFLKLRLSL